LCGEIRTFEQATRDAQTRANEMVVEMEHPRAGRLQLLGTPIRLHSTPATHRTPPPELGEHNKAVLAELGYAAEQIAELEQQGVLG
jgi:crotonobetainyl-CoA:carnitine CoA-transferase CaiB-like acyl-CoA transferase